MLVSFTLAMGCIMPIAAHWRSTRQQQRDVDLMMQDAYVAHIWEHRNPFWGFVSRWSGLRLDDVIMLDLEAPHLPTHQRRLTHFPQLKRLYAEGVNEALLLSLPRYPHLTHVRISLDVDVSIEGMRALSRCRNLESVSIQLPNPTDTDGEHCMPNYDAAIEALAELPRLKELRLPSAHFSLEAILSVVRSGRLTMLHTAGYGLPELRRMPNIPTALAEVWLEYPTADNIRAWGRFPGVTALYVSEQAAGRMSRVAARAARALPNTCQFYEHYPRERYQYAWTKLAQ